MVMFDWSVALRSVFEKVILDPTGAPFSTYNFTPPTKFPSEQEFALIASLSGRHSLALSGEIETKRLELEDCL